MQNGHDFLNVSWRSEIIQSSTQDSRDFSRERNVQNKLVFNMGLKPVLKIEPPADRRAAQRETHRVRRAARARSEIAIYSMYQYTTLNCVAGIVLTIKSAQLQFGPAHYIFRVQIFFSLLVINNQSGLR